MECIVCPEADRNGGQQFRNKLGDPSRGQRQQSGNNHSTRDDQCAIVAVVDLSVF